MTEGRAFYHEGMRALQDRFDGRRVADGLAAHRRRWDFWDDDRVMIETAPFFFIATSFGEYSDCSMRSGMPGFVKIVAPGTIEFPEYDGNSMYRTLGNISRNPNVGLLFVKFDGKTVRIRINGQATILDDAETLARHHGAKLIVRVVCELFSNCPRAVHDLEGGRLSAYLPRPGYEPPAPEWKSRDYIRDILPEGRSASRQRRVEQEAQGEFMMDTKLISTVLRDAAGSGDLPGVVAAAANSDGVIFEGGFGTRDLATGVPMSADTVVWIASMTKAITAACAMQLVEHGKLSLDGDIAAILPDLGRMQVLEGFDAGGQPRVRAPKRGITLRHLLTHTSGFAYDMWNADVLRYMEATGTPGIISCKNAALAVPLMSDPGREMGIRDFH